MAVLKNMASQFSLDGKYFAQISTEGKLKIWETSSSNLLQEFTPDFHLTSPCTCLQFIQIDSSNKTNGSPKKKIKKRHSLHTNLPYITLGTTSGSLFVYSLSKGELDYNIKNDSGYSINCISWCEGTVVYTGAEQEVICWDLEYKTVKSKWKAGNEKISAILALPQTNKILTASRNIKLWNVTKKEVLKTFTGHSHEVNILQYIRPGENSDMYFISGSTFDRLISCWNLKENQQDKNAVVSFLMEDIASSASVMVSASGATNLTVMTRSGVVHVYQHTLNGKCSKPLKPITTLQVASDTGQNNDTISPIPILAARINEDQSLLIGHGNSLILTFENVTINDYQKVQCLVRKDPKAMSASKESEFAKSKTPGVENNVHYLTPQTSKAAVKRKVESNGQMEVPMEKRLENLTLNKLDDSKVPKANNVAQLLVQGLHSKDKSILRSVLIMREETVITNTVRRLPLTVIVPLVDELTNMVRGKTIASKIGATWLKIVLNVHAGILLSQPNLPNLLGPAVGCIENRLNLQNPLNKLRGRLDMLVAQTTSKESEVVQNEESLLMYNDKDEMSDMELEALQHHSESENEWNQESDDDEEDVEMDKIDLSD